MIKAVKLADKNVNFEKKPEKSNQGEETKLLPNNMNTRLRQTFDKTASAFTEYPVKGLKGDVNSNFYEFLTMGIVPYLAGSAMFMALFNLVHKHLDLKAQTYINGKKMALGVVLYGLAKTFSKNLVTKPVKWATGVDTEMPYRNVNYPLPKEPGEAASITPEHQQRKVFDSNEFYRKDVLNKDDPEFYNRMAKKLGAGNDLNCSEGEMTPIVQNIISTSNVAKSLSSYAWAGAAVGLAAQDSWRDFFDAISNRRRHIPKEGEGFFNRIGTKLKNAGGNAVDISKTFGKSFVKACKTLWSGEQATSGFMKHAGKAWLIFTAALTAATTLNVIGRARGMVKDVNKNVIDKEKESTVI